MIIVTSLDLSPFLGRSVTVRDLRSGRRRGSCGRVGRLALQDGQRGEYTGPILVRREVDRVAYIAWQEADGGRPLTLPERRAIVQPRLRFYEIAID